MVTFLEDAMSEKVKSAVSQAEGLQFWQMVFETFQAGGLTVRQFCRQEGITESNFYYWRKKLRRSSTNHAGGGKPAMPVESEHQSPPPPFTVLGQMSVSGPELRIEFPGDIRIYAGYGCDRQLLRETINLLRG